MDVENGLCPTKPAVKPCDFADEPLVLGDGRCIQVRLPPTSLGYEAGECGLVTLLSPHAQVRRVDAFATEQGAELPRLGEPICFLKDTGLVLSGKPLSTGFSGTAGSLRL